MIERPYVVGASLVTSTRYGPQEHPGDAAGPVAYPGFYGQAQIDAYRATPKLGDERKEKGVTPAN